MKGAPKKRKSGGGKSDKGKRSNGSSHRQVLLVDETATTGAGPHVSHAFGEWDAVTAKPVSSAQSHWLMDENVDAGSATVLKLVDWNCLAQAYTYAHFYKHLSNCASTLAWNKRSKMIYEALRLLNGDIVCLQEIDAWGEVQSVMAGFGYDGVFQSRTGHKTDGLAVLWKRDKLAPIGGKEVLLYGETLGKEGEDRVAVRICLSLLKAPERRVTVCTTHLDYKRPRVQVEMCHMFAQFVLDARKEARDLIVACGDFNSELFSEAVQTFVAESKLSSALPLCGPLGHPVFTACIKDPKNIDHLFYDDRFARVVGIVAPLMSSAKLPHDAYPSDHVLVGAAFELTGK
jgi:endonuclease/exonuclease/phosphatase family metal-dependent hydrolase